MRKGQGPGDFGVDIQLLAELATQRMLGRFIGLDFSARKLPLSSEVHVREAPRHDIGRIAVPLAVLEHGHRVDEVVAAAEVGEAADVDRQTPLPGGLDGLRAEVDAPDPRLGPPIGHPPQETVTLVVQSLTSSETQTLEGVPMTRVNRRAIRNAAQAREREGLKRAPR